MWIKKWKMKKTCNRQLKEIQLEEMKEKIINGAIVVDVRSYQEYNEGHIDGAIVIPEYELRKRALEELPDKEQEIVVYCRSGIRSKKAQKILEKLGYKNVYNLYNGWRNY